MIDYNIIKNALKPNYINMINRYKDKLINKEYTCYPVMVGSKFGETYDKTGKPLRFMFVGRAMNGWQTDFKSSLTEQLVDEIFATHNHIEDVAINKIPCEEPDSNGKQKYYFYSRSPFFQLIHRILEQYGNDSDWARRFAWSNLYKMAPHDCGNPESELQKDIIQDCTEILKKEIEIIQPTHIVFITGDWWYQPNLKKDKNSPAINFSDIIGVQLNTDSYRNNVISGNGISDITPNPKVIITRRPERAGITRIEHAKQIVNAFNSL